MAKSPFSSGRASNFPAFLSRNRNKWTPLCRATLLLSVSFESNSIALAQSTMEAQSNAVRSPAARNSTRNSSLHNSGIGKNAGERSTRSSSLAGSNNSFGRRSVLTEGDCVDS